MGLFDKINNSVIVKQSEYVAELESLTDRRSLLARYVISASFKRNQLTRT